MLNVELFFQLKRTDKAKRREKTVVPCYSRAAYEKLLKFLSSYFRNIQRGAVRPLPLPGRAA